jgi:hypothetical protein
MAINPQSTTHADALNWTPAPAGWPSSDDALDAAIALLPEIGDDLTADVIEALTLAIVELNERLDATRTAYSTTLKLLHVSQREAKRLRNRLDELLDAKRAEAAR